MSTKLNRRALMAGAAAVPLASATAVAGQGDADLRRLWSEYLVHADTYAAAREKLAPVRAAFDAELPPCPDDVLPCHHWQDHQWLWHKHGLDPLTDAWNAADSAMRKTIAAIILATEATGLFGIGVKLAAGWLDPEDQQDAIAAALGDIDRLLGSGFAERFADRLEESAREEDSA
jgi:hypothetical protein